MGEVNLDTLREVCLDSRSGDYYDPRTRERVCVAYFDGEPQEIGRYNADLPPRARIMASRLVWDRFLRRAPTEKGAEDE